MKSRNDIAHQMFLGVMDIKTLYRISYAKAKKVFAAADKIDSQELGGFRIDPRLVRITSVCKVTGVSMNLIWMQANDTKEDTK